MTVDTEERTEVGMRIAFGRPIFGEDIVADLPSVLKHKTLTNGGLVVGFEEDFQSFTDGGIAIAVSSCAAALHITMIELGIGPGDEVIVPALTHVATAHAVELTGATPVFVDVNSSGNIDPELVEPNDRTKAIMAVHYLGQAAPLGKIIATGIPVIEDCALALGTRANGYCEARHVGLNGRAGCFSFYPVKQITTCEGGMLLTRDMALAQRYREIRTFGLSEGLCHRLGNNYRMTELQAALGRSQMKRIRRWTRIRTANLESLNYSLRDMETVGGPYAMTVFLENRDEVRRKMLLDGVETSVYYPIPVPLHPYYREKYWYTEGDFPVAERFSRESLCLPLGPHIKEKQMAYMLNSFRKAMR